MQYEHVFINSDKRPKFNWNIEAKVARKKQVGRKIGECLTLWRGSLYSTSCEQPAYFACENRRPYVTNKYVFLAAHNYKNYYNFFHFNY